MMNTDSIKSACVEAAQLLSRADGLLITAGAGIGIDSGLPDFRGEHGFWRAYPALGTLGMRFHEIANPAAFHSMPEVAWGFYGHRLQLYRRTQPHAGFAKLLALSRQLPKGAGIFTSNVDGQFQKAGFPPDRTVECHGTIHYLQCLNGCGQDPWPADAFEPVIDTRQCKLLSALPTCPDCGGLARPNILMFGDWDWDGSTTERQLARLDAWLSKTESPVVMEIGAGTAIPTVRRYGESLGCPIIRINPTESRISEKRDVGIPLGALDGITHITDAMATMKQILHKI